MAAVAWNGLRDRIAGEGHAAIGGPVKLNDCATDEASAG